jgi:hypothetical protein
MRFGRRARCAAWIAVSLLVGACGDSGSSGADASAELSPAVAAWWTAAQAGQWRSLGDDRIEVWVCHVPDGATDPIYGGLPLRLPLTPDAVIAALDAPVSAYFDTISHGQYRPTFVSGGEYTMAVDDAPQACIDAALDAAADDTRAVLAVADAEHGADQVGGFAVGGDPCPAASPCSARDSRRFAYVGASDFHPDWGDAPPMDLVEHELGHTLGWVHSAVTTDLVYESAIDVMSNSAAPRELVDTRRDAADTLAVNHLAAGWLPLSDVWVAPTGGGTTRLSPAAGGNGTRLVLLPATDGFLTVEVLTANGYDDHLPADGVAVHRVTLTNAVISDITPVFGEPPYTALLQPGASVTTDGWTVTIGDDWAITATAAPAG